MAEAMEPTIVSDASKPSHSAVLAPEELAPFFPQYEILRMLGRGGMGAVYLARQISLNRLVAIKILPADMGDSDLGFAERFKNEAQAMAQLSHPGIVAVFDFGQTSHGLLYIVMEYIEGTDVQLMLASQGRLHSAHAMAITAHVCDALQYAHSCGIIHRDIKPSNIMVGNNGVVKVADFGLAKMSQGHTTGLTQSGMAMGTLHFMAPEALTLGSAVDQRADIYAVGVMLYQMLTGKLPQGMFEMPSFQVAGLDPRYDRIVAKALRDDREVRYQAAADLRYDLDAILTQPVEKMQPDAATEVKALPPVEVRGKKKARVPSLASPHTDHGVPPKKKPLGLLLTVLGVSAVLAATIIYFRGHKTGPTTTQPALAAKEQPFVNSLGMKFVPVPGTGVLFCIHETRRQDYAAFAAETPGIGSKWKTSNANGVPCGHEADHPVVDVSWNDAKAFCEWLSKKEQREYNLPTDHEWSLAVGLDEDSALAKSRTPEELNNHILGQYPWGTQWPPPERAGNYADASAWRAGIKRRFDEAVPYDDGYPTTAPVMSFLPNKWGIFDLGGNVYEWCDDWYNASKTAKVERGASWFLVKNPQWLLSSGRNNSPPTSSTNSNGFRVVLKIGAGTGNATPPRPPAMASTPDGAERPGARDKGFTNTLGMKFAPVPIIGGPTDGKRVLFSIWETRVQDYEAFVKETHHEWLKAPFEQDQTHPAVNLSWNDAQSFCAWLTERERKAGKISYDESYRLPSDHEWSCAAGIQQMEDLRLSPKENQGKVGPVYAWGKTWPPPAGAGNFSGKEAAGYEVSVIQKIITSYHDDFPVTAPVGSFAPDHHGLFDLAGNVWEFCEDRFTPDSEFHVSRGSSFLDSFPQFSSLGPRAVNRPNALASDRGFRVVLAPLTTTAKIAE